MNDTAGAPLLASDTTREDITYYQMSLRALDRWNRPSLIAIRKSRDPSRSYQTDIVPRGVPIPADIRSRSRIAGRYAFDPRAARNSDHHLEAPPERRGLPIPTLRTRASCSLSFGLHAQRSVGPLPFPFVRALNRRNSFRAILTDLTPTIPLSQLDIDVESIVASAGSTPSNHRFVCTAQFLAKYEEDNARLFEKESVSQAERDWTSQIRQIRPSTFLREKEINWADFRYNW